MPVKFWWPTSMPAQLIVVQNLSAKIGGYAIALGLTPLQVTTLQGLCTAFVTAFNLTEQSRSTMQSMTQWRDIVFYGEPVGSAAGAPPFFPEPGEDALKRGTVQQIFAFRDLIVASPGYTQAIGEDLGIVGTEQPNRPSSDYTPELKTTTSIGYNVTVTGSMQGMDALKVEYAPKGGNFATVAFLTNTPGGFQITPATPGEPETGHIRAVFIKKNEVFGNYSADYPVTLS